MPVRLQRHHEEGRQRRGLHGALWPVGCFFGEMFQAHHFFNKGGTKQHAKLDGLPKGNKGGAICQMGSAGVLANVIGSGKCGQFYTSSKYITAAVAFAKGKGWAASTGGCAAKGYTAQGDSVTLPASVTGYKNTNVAVVYFTKPPQYGLGKGCSGEWTLILDAATCAKAKKALTLPRRRQGPQGLHQLRLGRDAHGALPRLRRRLQGQARSGRREQPVHRGGEVRLQGGQQEQLRLRQQRVREVLRRLQELRRTLRRGGLQRQGQDRLHQGAQVRLLQRLRHLRHQVRLIPPLNSFLDQDSTRSACQNWTCLGAFTCRTCGTWCTRASRWRTSRSAARWGVYDVEGEPLRLSTKGLRLLRDEEKGGRGVHPPMLRGEGVIITRFNEHQYVVGTEADDVVIEQVSVRNFAGTNHGLIVATGSATVTGCDLHASVRVLEDQAAAEGHHCPRLYEACRASRPRWARAAASPTTCTRV